MKTPLAPITRQHVSVRVLVCCRLAFNCAIIISSSSHWHWFMWPVCLCGHLTTLGSLGKSSFAIIFTSWRLKYTSFLCKHQQHHGYCCCPRYCSKVPLWEPQLVQKTFNAMIKMEYIGTQHSIASLLLFQWQIPLTGLKYKYKQPHKRKSAHKTNANWKVKLWPYMENALSTWEQSLTYNSWSGHLVKLTAGPSTLYLALCYSWYSLVVA